MFFCEIERALVKHRLTFFKADFERMMKKRGGARKWSEVVVFGDRLKQAVLFVRNHDDFDTLNHGDSLGKIREISLLCLKMHELKPFHLDNYFGKRDINACLNSMCFYDIVAEIRRRNYKKILMNYSKPTATQLGMEFRAGPPPF